MRTNSFITSLWNEGGPYVGDRKPHGRVTVQLPWPDLGGDHTYDVLRTTYDLGVGIYKQRGVPLRWFQDVANDQLELEVPSVKQIHTTRSIDSDAAQFDITIYNQRMWDNDAGPANAQELGQPGYYSFGRGSSLDAQARWGQAANEWENLLVPNAIIRTYQGYGGNSKTISQAVTDGNLMLTGTWLVDHVEIHTDGTIRLTGRDMAKLLLDQQLYLPLVPKNDYPLTYYRWQVFNVPVRAASRTNVTSISAGDKNTVYADSSEARWYGGPGANPSIHGHYPSEAVDGNVNTYWYSVGNSGPDKPFATNWIEFSCGEAMNAVYIHPWAGNYTCYVSVLENGQWQGDPNNLIPYDPSILFATQSPAVDTGANIPFVTSFGVPWETPGEYILPRGYQAERVRITFRDLTYTPDGPWHYRAGVREFKIRASQGATVGSPVTVEPLFLDADSSPTSGYVTVETGYTVDAFGDARVQQLSTGKAEGNGVATSIRMTKSGHGYYILAGNGRLTAYGDAVWHGDPDTDGLITPLTITAVDIALTPSGDGYWILDSVGGIHNYGDANPYGPVNPSSGPRGVTLMLSCESLPGAQGLWTLDGNGHVNGYGAATNYGSLSGTVLDAPAGSPIPTEVAVRLRRNSTGDGYWILTTTGRVEAKGAATDFGQPAQLATLDGNWRTGYWGLMPHSDDSGYLILRGDGTITDFGLSTLMWFYGSPIPGQQAEQRKDGNYLDYTDIIRDLLLWAGFTFYDPALPANAVPDVYGNLESTGGYSPDPLPTDMFDKKPVMDAIHAIKEVVGYLAWVDDEGAFRFESPNWWGPGNFDEFGQHTNTMLQLDELVTLIDYVATVSDDALRSLVIISSEDPDQAAANTTVTTRLIPSSAKELRGLVKPAMWVNGFFLRPEEQKIMAELIALHSWFQTRVGQVTCAANPCLQINDQVRIWERQAAETYVHYVRGVDTTMDLDSGSYTMTVTTNWLGDETNWAVQNSGTFVSTNDADPAVSLFWWKISNDLERYLQKTGSAAAQEFLRKPTPALTAVVPGSQTGTGAGPA